MYPTSTCGFHFIGYIYNIGIGILCCIVAFQMNIAESGFISEMYRMEAAFLQQKSGRWPRQYMDRLTIVITKINMPGHRNSESSI